MKLDKNEAEFNRAQLKRVQRYNAQLKKAQLIKELRKKNMKFVVMFLALTLFTFVSAILSQKLYGISSFYFEFLFNISLTLFFATLTINMIITLKKQGKISFGFKCLNVLFMALIAWGIYGAVKQSIDIGSIMTSNYSVKSGTVTGVNASTSGHGHTSMSFWIDETYFYTDNFLVMKRIKKGEMVEIKYLPSSKYIIELNVRK